MTGSNCRLSYERSITKLMHEVRELPNSAVSIL
nr:MAG TPA: hypothetical protein [Caudoviricetes sp.]DAO43074.1 MAG TPA: hypothetical protein [Caudoviricetes sp.]